MSMDDWVVANYQDPNNPNGIWVCKTNANFPNIHLSQSVENPVNNHVGTDAPPASVYWYGMKDANAGVMPHFAGANGTPTIRANLQAAWNDYYTV